jgi:hypothetical protein
MVSPPSMRPTEGKLRFGPYQGKEHHACLTVAVEKPRCDDLIKILSKFKQFLHTFKYLFIYVNINFILQYRVQHTADFMLFLPLNVLNVNVSDSASPL